MDLTIEDGSRISTVYFDRFEEVVRKVIALPWGGVTVCYREKPSQRCQEDDSIDSIEINPGEYGAGRARMDCVSSYELRNRDRPC